MLVGMSVSGQGSGFGAGLILGEPTGISVKGWLDGEHAIDGALAWSLSHDGAMSLHGDYLFHKMDLIHVSKGQLPLYFGPGLRLRFWNGNDYWRNGHEYHDGDGGVDLAVRFPVGLAYLFDGAPVDAFVELVPMLNLVPDTWFEFDAAIGGRYWF